MFHSSSLLSLEVISNKLNQNLEPNPRCRVRQVYRVPFERLAEVEKNPLSTLPVIIDSPKLHALRVARYLLGTTRRVSFEDAHPLAMEICKTMSATYETGVMATTLDLANRYFAGRSLEQQEFKDQLLTALGSDIASSTTQAAARKRAMELIDEQATLLRRLIDVYPEMQQEIMDLRSR